ncbi:MAG: hypothetical protein QM533_02175 [Cytophagales bacterium]|nr:hypothetical protein [Cytophagales bacterium]
MTTSYILKTRLTRLTAVTTLIALTALFIPLGASAGLMSWADQSVQSKRIKAEHKTDEAACKVMHGNAQDICKQEAKYKAKVAYAELSYARSGMVEDARKVSMLKADGAYAVAKKHCDDLDGNPKDVCRAEAKAVHVKAIADSTLTKKVNDAKSNAEDKKLEADYKVALEKCEITTGAERISCINSAKTSFKHN